MARKPRKRPTQRQLRKQSPTPADVPQPERPPAPQPADASPPTSPVNPEPQEALAQTEAPANPVVNNEGVDHAQPHAPVDIDNPADATATSTGDRSSPQAPQAANEPAQSETQTVGQDTTPEAAVHSVGETQTTPAIELTEPVAEPSPQASDEPDKPHNEITHDTPAELPPTTPPPTPVDIHADPDEHQTTQAQPVAELEPTDDNPIPEATLEEPEAPEIQIDPIPDPQADPSIPTPRDDHTLNDDASQAPVSDERPDDPVLPPTHEPEEPNSAHTPGSGIYDPDHADTLDVAINDLPPTPPTPPTYPHTSSHAPHADTPGGDEPKSIVPRNPFYGPGEGPSQYFGPTVGFPTPPTTSPIPEPEEDEGVSHVQQDDVGTNAPDGLDPPTTPPGPATSHNNHQAPAPESSPHMGTDDGSGDREETSSNQGVPPSNVEIEPATPDDPSLIVGTTTPRHAGHSKPSDHSRVKSRSRTPESGHGPSEPSIQPPPHDADSPDAADAPTIVDAFAQAEQTPDHPRLPVRPGTTTNEAQGDGFSPEDENIPGATSPSDGQQLNDDPKTQIDPTPRELIDDTSNSNASTPNPSSQGNAPITALENPTNATEASTSQEKNNDTNAEIVNLLGQILDQLKATHTLAETEAAMNKNNWTELFTNGFPILVEV